MGESHMKETSWIQKLEQIPQKVDRILKNRYIAGALLLFQGINLTLHPDRAPEGMAKSISMSVIIACAVWLVSWIFSKEKPGSFTSLPGIVLIASISIYFYLNPGWLASSLRYVIGLSALLTGCLNLAQLLRMEKVIDWEQDVNQKIRSELSSHVHPDIANEMQKSLDAQIQQTLTPTMSLLRRLDHASVGKWFTCILTILVGVCLLVFPFQSGNEIIRFSGIALLISGVSDLYTAIRFRKKRAVQPSEQSEGKG